MKSIELVGLGVLIMMGCGKDEPNNPPPIVKKVEAPKVRNWNPAPGEDVMLYSTDPSEKTILGWYPAKKRDGSRTQGIATPSVGTKARFIANAPPGRDGSLQVRLKILEGEFTDMNIDIPQKNIRPFPLPPRG